MPSKTLVPTLFRPLTVITFSMLSLASLLCSPQGRAALLEMADLVAHPEHYDHQAVVVMGKVSDVQAITDREGQSAFKFLLEDGSGTLKVMTHREVAEGDYVIVEGVFSRRRQAGRVTVYNEVKATTIRPLNRFTPDLVG